MSWITNKLVRRNFSFIISVLVVTSSLTLAQSKRNQSSSAQSQLADYSSSNPGPSVLTSSWGRPVGDIENSLTAGRYGPVLMQDTTFFDVMQSFNRERIPERVVHAKGAGGHGYFQVTHDITMYCNARLFSSVGSQTDVTVRFSQAEGETGSADTMRDVRGFAVKFRTQDGIWDLVGNNLPVFFIRDAILFPQLMHSHRRNPQTHLRDSNMYWDFANQRTESLYLIMYINSPLGIPYSYRHMNGFGVHAFRLVNATGQVTFGKFHWRTCQGLRNLTNEEAGRISSNNSDFYIQDLYNAISSAQYPRWNLSIQVMTPSQAKNVNFNPFDSTKEWPESDYPLLPVGTMVLNRNPENYFTDVEEAAFSPSRLVPYIEPSPDKMLQGRLFAYTDTQNYRLGSNNLDLRVNRGVVPITNYMRDGFSKQDINQDGSPNYYPNSFNGPRPAGRDVTSYLINGDLARYDTSDDDNFSQPRELWGRMSGPERDVLVANLATSLRTAYPSIQDGALENFYRVSPQLSSLLAARLGRSQPT